MAAMPSTAASGAWFGITRPGLRRRTLGTSAIESRCGRAAGGGSAARGEALTGLPRAGSRAADSRRRLLRQRRRRRRTRLRPRRGRLGGGALAIVGGRPPVPPPRPLRLGEVVLRRVVARCGRRRPGGPPPRAHDRALEPLQQP